MAGKKTTVGRHGLPTKGQDGTDAPSAAKDDTRDQTKGRATAKEGSKAQTATKQDSKAQAAVDKPKDDAPVVRDAAPSDKTPDAAPASKPDSKPAPTERPTSIPPSNAAPSNKTSDAAPASKPDSKSASTERPTSIPPSNADKKPAETAPLPVVTPPDITPRKGGIMAPLLGGVLAAGIGFGAAYWLLPQLNLLDHPQDTTALETRIAAGEGDIQALAQRLDDLPPLDTGALDARDDQMQTRMTELSEQATGLTDQLADLTARIETLEARPAGTGSSVSPGDLSALEGALATQSEQIAALDAKLNADETARQEAAQAAATATLRRAAVMQIRTAVDTGVGFAPALSDLEQTGLTAPDALNAAAEGVPTLASLQDTFAPAARAALAAARTSGETSDEGGSKFWSFMGDQLGARSLEPREGPGTDATLSRAEAALRAARLDDALAEIETLPDPARAQMTDWAATARSRLEATQALDALSAELN